MSDVLPPTQHTSNALISPHTGQPWTHTHTTEAHTVLDTCNVTGNTDYATCEVFIALLSKIEDDAFVMIGVPPELQHNIELRLLQCRKRHQRLRHDMELRQQLIDDQINDDEKGDATASDSVDEKDDEDEEDEEEDEWTSHTLSASEIREKRLLFFVTK